ncbi:MAG: hypothetical protein HFI33_08545 [Lachnospiraceae bacterium]|nr:hypothetical protein [Lachnospiraceae bacterium]
MIYLTGDCHGSFSRFARKKRERLPYKFTEEDFLIICGDFGLLWARDEEFAYHLRWLSSLPFRILWVQGNHENYDMIAEYPLEHWQGGKVRHMVRDRIILLERGQIFQIEGKKFFTFGGASSHDIQGGILDRGSPDFQRRKQRALKQELPYRIRHESWWEQELPTEAEMQEGRDQLSRARYQVDYVITHCLSTGMQKKLAGYYGNLGSKLFPPDILTDYFQELEENLQYKQWFCGHYHEDLRLDSKHKILYQKILCLRETWGAEEEGNL